MKKISLFFFFGGGFFALLTILEFIYVVSYRSNQRITMQQISIWIIAIFQSGYLSFIAIRGGLRSRRQSSVNSWNFLSVFESDTSLIKASFAFYQIATLVEYFLIVFSKNVFSLLTTYEDFMSVFLFWLSFTQYAYFGILLRHIVILPRMEDEAMSWLKSILLNIISRLWLIYSGVTLFFLIVILSRESSSDSETHNARQNFNFAIFFVKTSLVINLFKKRTSTKFAYLLLLFLNIITIWQAFSGLVIEATADDKIDFFELFITVTVLIIVAYLLILWRTTLQIIPFMKNCYSEILRNGVNRSRGNFLRRAQRDNTEVLSINNVNVAVASDALDRKIREKLQEMIKPFQSMKKGGEEAGEESCVICSQEMLCGEEVMTIPCGHIYHPACIWPWFDIRSTCPVCRKELK